MVWTQEMRDKAAATRAANVAAKKAEPPLPKSGLYAGISVVDCADGCTAKACVISGKPYCAHPAKGGLQPLDAGSPAALARLNAAKKILGDRKVVVE